MEIRFGIHVATLSWAALWMLVSCQPFTPNESYEESSTGTECADVPGFVDAQGYSCADWIGSDCSDGESYGYSQAEEDAIKANCRMSCGLCGGGGGGGGSLSIGGYSVYFGNLHSHTSVSDGAGSPAEAYAYARNTAGLDFFGIADHDYYPSDMTSPEWATIQNAANAANVDGTFVAFAGFEWTSDSSDWQEDGLALGHVAILNSAEFCNSGKEPTRTLNQLVDWLATQDDAIAFFNHPGQYGTTFDKFVFNHSDKFVGMELWNRSSDYYSNDGYYANDGGKSYYDEALGLGWYIGAAGGQDNHDADWGTANEWRVAVLSTEKTRASIAEALRARRFYSSRDKDLALFFACNGAPMGSRIAPGTLACQIEAFDGGNEGFASIELIVNGAVAEAWTLADAHPILSHSLVGNAGDTLYVRLYQANQASMWAAISSPIFISSN